MKQCPYDYLSEVFWSEIWPLEDYARPMSRDSHACPRSTPAYPGSDSRTSRFDTTFMPSLQPEFTGEERDFTLNNE